MNVAYQKICREGRESLMREKRGDIVEYAQSHGNKPAARHFNISVNTVKKWRRRKKNGMSYDNLSTVPHTFPRAMKPYWRFKIIDTARTEIDRLENRRASASKPIVIQGTWIQRTTKCPYSATTIRKLLVDEGLRRVKPRPRQKMISMLARKQKELLEPFSLIEVDVKYLDDIHGYCSYIDRYNAPKRQFTARDVRTGALYIGCGSGKTATHAAIFIDIVCEHLARSVIDLSRVVFQTDNGSEFTTPIHCDHASSYTFFIAIEKWGASHRLIPVGKKNNQADVETSHKLIEDELYLHMLAPRSYEELWGNIDRYVNHFNHTRHNQYKGGSPRDILRRIAPAIDERVLDWRVIDLDRHMTRARLDEHATWYKKARETGLQERVRISMRMPYLLP